jgi:integrase
MRLSEMIHLEWSDIDLSQSTATLHTTKNGEVRHVPLSRKAKELLNKLPRHIESQKIFWRWLTASGFEASWQRVVKKSNLVDFRFHDLRHEATSRLFEKGLSMMEVSLVTGHKTLQMLKRYTHLDAQDIAQKLNYK